MDDPVIDIQDLVFAYNGETIFQDINLQVQRGDFVAIIGPNGGGKTTLLKLVLGLLKPHKGEIRVMGQAACQAAPGI